MKKTILLFSILLTMGVTQTYAENNTHAYSYTTPSGTITIDISHTTNTLGESTTVIFQNNNTGNSITIYYFLPIDSVNGSGTVFTVTVVRNGHTYTWTFDDGQGGQGQPQSEIASNPNLQKYYVTLVLKSSTDLINWTPFATHYLETYNDKEFYKADISVSTNPPTSP